jgi:FKBP-type peptidyl-prolyl cis-trans isomerase 2
MSNNGWISRAFALTLITVFTFSAQWVLAGEPETVKKGDKVTLDYTGLLKDGTVFDSSKNHDSPLSFVVGSGQVIKGFDEAVLGMKVGDEKKFTLSPAEAYGEPNPKMFQEVPRKNLPPNQEPKVGMMLIVGSPSGKKMQATISEVKEDTVTLNLNHPLAGKALTFDIKLATIEAASMEGSRAKPGGK